MKNKYILGALLISITSLFTACTDDNDSNPTLIQPTEFVLNTPAYANETVDLQNTSEISLSWSQPKYTAENAPINATYEVQISPTNSFTISKAEADKDKSGETVADYYAFSKTTTLCNTSFTGTEIDKALVKLMGWTEDATPDLQDVYIRVVSYIAEGTKRLNSIESNSVKLSFKPYFVLIEDATPIMWYLVGNMFGGKWGSKIGIDALPMFLIPDFDYDKETGEGEIEYTNYFTTGDYKSNNECDGSGFKIQPADFNWDYGMTGDNRQKGTIIYRNGEGDGGHIVAPENGYYTIKMNTKDKTATMKKYEDPVTDHGTIQIAGSFNGWADEPMLPYNTTGVENHAWYYVLEVTPDTYNEATGTCCFKFKEAGPSNVNWGFGKQKGAVNMSGKGSNGAEDLGLTEGKYVISFNDITGAFSIVKLQ